MVCAISLSHTGFLLVHRLDKRPAYPAGKGNTLPGESETGKHGMDTHFDIVIVGGGLSGIATLYHLSKRARTSCTNPTCLLLESNDQVGGLAYSTSSNAQFLNVPAGKMGIDEEAAGDFGSWLARHGHTYAADAFVPRHLYREYLKQVLNGVIAHGSIRVTRAKARIEEIRRDGTRALLLAQGEVVASASTVIIAVGNSLAPESVREPFSHPWLADDLERAAKKRSVAIIGSSLSAVDVILDLESRGYSGTYTVMSRRGLFPHEHLPTAPYPSPAEFIRQLHERPTTREMVRAFRYGVRRGADWRALLDSIRGDTPSIWRALPDIEKKRFIRHVRPYWDIHRHRIPEESHQALLDLTASERLIVQKRRFMRASPSERGLVVESTNRGQRYHDHFDAVFDCRGLWTDLLKGGSSFIVSVVEQGLGEVDPLRLGFQCDQNGRLLARDIQRGPEIYTLGSLRRGEQWESTAAREIRIQAAEIAESIVTDLSSVR